MLRLDSAERFARTSRTAAGSAKTEAVTRPAQCDAHPEQLYKKEECLVMATNVNRVAGSEDQLLRLEKQVSVRK